MTVFATLPPLSVLSHGTKIVSCVLKIDVMAADYVSLQPLHFESFAQIWALVVLLLSVI